MSTAASTPLGIDLLERVGNTPLLRMNRIARWLPERVQVYAKAEFMNPGGSVKDRPAKNMMLQAIKRGDLGQGKTLLDSTSGNTGIAYAMFGAALGIPVELVMPETASAKKDIIEAYGAHIRFTDPMEGSDGALIEAQRLYKENPGKYYLPDQYNNDDNWRAHYLTTAEEIWRQTEQKVTHFVAGIGTGGTLTGTGRRLKELNPKISVVAVEPATPLHGLEGLKHMESSIVPGIYDATVHDRKAPVFTEDAYEMSCRLAREEGIFVGYSAGAALQGALEIAMGLKEGVIVTVFPDAGERYLGTRFWADLITLFEKEGK